MFGTESLFDFQSPMARCKGIAENMSPNLRPCMPCAVPEKLLWMQEGVTCMLWHNAVYMTFCDITRNFY